MLLCGPGVPSGAPALLLLYLSSDGPLQALNGRAASLQLSRAGSGLLRAGSGLLQEPSPYWPTQASLQPDALSYRLQHGVANQHRASISHPQAVPSYGGFASGHAYQAAPAAHAAYAPAFSSTSAFAPQAAQGDVLRASSLYQSANALALQPSQAAAPMEMQRAGSTGLKAQPVITSQAAPAPPNGYHSASQDQVLSQLMQGLTHLTNEVSALKANRASIDSTAGTAHLTLAPGAD